MPAQARGCPARRRAIGVFYWEPTWYAVPGNGWDPADINNSGDGWDNMAVFNWTGRLNPTIRWIS
ncbi:glycosyl hydrolase 53 family protein [Streptomyces javensis]|uniref:glycosyl hydrolase 53 family protein n=1 Tax=Streptomyces javensis TaxID=114698 RepID=UPI003F4CCB34